MGAHWEPGVPHPAQTKDALAEAQPIPTWGADPRPCCNAGESKEQPNLSFTVLFCSTLIFLSHPILA